MKRSVIIAATAAALAGGGIWYGLSQRHPEPTPTPAAKRDTDRIRIEAGAPQLAYLQVAAATTRPLPLTDRLNARIAFDDTVTARIFPAVAGRVIALNAELGDPVRKGAPLATIDSPDFGSAVSDLSKAEADASLKDKALARAKILVDGGVLARRDFEAAEADSRASRAEVERARLRLGNLAPGGARVEGERMTLRAPIDGIVADRQANPGTEVRPDAANPLFVVSDLSRLWLLIDLPEQDLGKLRLGEPVNVVVDAYPDARFTATVDRISPLLDPATRRVQVRCRLPNADGRLRPEMFARVNVAARGDAEVVRLPVSALVSEGLYPVVFVETAPREFVKRRVAIARQDSEFAYLKPGAEGGVNPGESVVVRGALLLSAELATGS